jgi:ferredoxin-fold anticodon binding domain-containing protein
MNKLVILPIKPRMNLVSFQPSFCNEFFTFLYKDCTEITSNTQSLFTLKPARRVFWSRNSQYLALISDNVQVYNVKNGQMVTEINISVEFGYFVNDCLLLFNGKFTLFEMNNNLIGSFYMDFDQISEFNGNFIVSYKQDFTIYNFKKEFPFLISKRNFPVSEMPLWKRFKRIFINKEIIVDSISTNEEYFLYLSQNDLFVHQVKDCDLILKYSHPGMKSATFSSNSTILIYADNDIVTLSIKNVNSSTISLKNLIENPQIIKSQNDKFYFSQNDQIYCFFMVSSTKLFDYYKATRQYEKALDFGSKNNIDLQETLQEYCSFQLLNNEVDFTILNQITDQKWLLDKTTNSILNSPFKLQKLLEFSKSKTENIKKEKLDQEINQIINGNCEKGYNVDLLFYRVKILKILDLIETFEVIYEKYFFENGNQIGDLLRDFIEKDLIDIAAEIASLGKIDALLILFTRHGDYLLPYRLYLLNLLPWSVSMVDFEKIAPRVQDMKPRRKSDWTDSIEIQEFVEMFNDTHHSIYRQDYPEPGHVIQEWYQKRIEHLHELGFVSEALQISKVAINCGFTELTVDSFHLDLLLFIDSGAKIYNLESLKKMEPKNLVLLLLDRMANGKIFSKYIFLICKMHNLNLLYILVEYSLKFPFAIVPILDELLEDEQTNEFVKIDEYIDKCAYEQETFDPDLWNTILKKLKRPGSDGWDNDLSFDKPSLSLHMRVAELFQSHGQLVTLEYCRQLQNVESWNILEKLLRKSIVLRSYSDLEWKSLLDTLLDLEFRDAFGNIKRSDLYALIITLALENHRYKVAQEIFYPNNGVPPLTSDRIEALVLNTAKVFYDNDLVGDKHSGLLKESMYCCGLLKPSANIIKFQNLIEATHFLCHIYHLEWNQELISPIQIRSQTKCHLLLRELLNQHPELHQSKDHIFELAKLLMDSIDNSQRINLLVSLGFGALLSCNFDCSIQYANDIILILEKNQVLPEANRDACSFFESLITSEKYTDYNSKLFLASIMVKISEIATLSHSISFWREQVKMNELRGLNLIQPSSKFDIIQQIEEIVVGDIDYGSLGPFEDIQHDFFKGVGSTLNGDYYLNVENVHTEDKKKIDFYMMQNSLLDARSDQDKISNNYFSIGKLLIHIDISLAITFLIAAKKVSFYFIQNDDEYFEYFQKLENNSTVNLVACYFFAFKAIALLDKSKHHTFLTDCHKAKLENLPEIVVEYFSSIDSSQANINKSLEYSKRFFTELQSTKRLHLRNNLLRLNGTDEILINNDPQYRKRKILELAQTKNEKELKIALELGREDGIPEYKVLESHIRWFFLNLADDSSVKLLRIELLTHIKGDYTTFAGILEKIYPEILKTQSNARLIEFYQLLLNINRMQSVLSDSDKILLENRLIIVQNLDLKGISNEIKIYNLLKSQLDIEIYYEMFELVGLYVGINGFIELMNSWFSFTPIQFFSCEAEYQRKQNFPTKLDHITAEILWRYIQTLEFEQLDRFRIKSAFHDLIPIFKSIDGDIMLPLLKKVVTKEIGMKIPLEVRTLICNSVQKPDKNIAEFYLIINFLEFLQKLSIVDFKSIKSTISEFEMSFESQSKVFKRLKIV